ncbi:MAG: 3-oxoacyl-ACP reductase [Acidobacteria bacterium RIFCSPLOWO2_12_FULL_67_14b]|nr:MAG: 3-oxoacyl-ACP reductase [Acidobacteria bacterium RIFCSPLOWO2_12_FULL_67_14b]
MGRMFSLSGKTIAVIGAGSGIGQAVAIGAAQQGGHVICLDLNADGAAATAATITKARGSADSGAVDITNVTSVRDALANSLHGRSGLDGLVCTPAINVRKPILKYTGEEFDRVVNVNLRGNFNVLQAAGQLMVLQKSGSIVLFSSIRSLVTEPGQSAYSMTKAGIVQLVRTAATEWGEQGVRVNAVGPGVVETPLTAPIKAQPEWYKAYADKTPMKRWAKAAEMAGPTIFLLSDAASYVTGTILFADGGWLANDGRFTPPGI